MSVGLQAASGGSPNGGLASIKRSIEVSLYFVQKK